MTARPFRLTPVDPLESERQASIVRYLQLENRVKLIIRINGGGRMIKGVFIWFYKLFVGNVEQKGKGVSDIVGMLRGGRFFAIEVKRPGEKPTAEQAAFLALVREAGGASGVACNWQQAKAIIAGSSNDEKTPQQERIPSNQARQDARASGAHGETDRRAAREPGLPEVNSEETS